MTDPLVANTRSDANVAPISGDIKAFQQMRALFGTMRRALMGRLTSFNGRRDYGKIFGWDDTVTAEGMLYMYNRGGIAQRLVDAYPDATWSRPPQIWAEGDDKWTKAWNDHVGDKRRAPKFWSTLHRLDKLASLGHYAVLLIGTDKPGLDRPLRNPKEILFRQPYGETGAKIDRWDNDATSPTFGQPIRYRMYPDNASGLTLSNTSGTQTTGPTRSSFLVDASRVLHVVRGNMEDEVYGRPIMAASWDYLTDLRKVVGSSSESYWLMANRGLQADVDKDMTLGPEDAAALENEVDEFMNGYRRFMRTKGVKIEALDNDVADPGNAFDVLVTLISGTSGIPKRILLGSEAGQLASTQDKGNWAERVEENRELHVEPHILVPYIVRLINLGLLPEPQGEVKILWPDAYRMNPLERGQTSAQTARTMANITKMLESKSPEAAKMLSRTEHRALLGFSTDNRILKDDPNP